MGLFATLKWLWDPRDADEKAYDAWDKRTPLQQHTQHLTIYIKDAETPFERTLGFKDFKISSFGNFRINVDREVRDWLDKCGTTGVKIDNVWYSPDQIVRIELGDVVTVDIAK